MLVQKSISELNLLLKASILSVEENLPESYILPKMGTENCIDESYNDTNTQDIQKKEITEEDIFNNTISSLFTENANLEIQSNINSIYIFV